MIFFLLSYIQSLFNHKLPAVFTYSSTRMALASITSLLLCIFIGPWFIRRLNALRIGQPIRKEECPPLGELHKAKEGTPTMGGVLILGSMLVSMLLWMDLTHAFTLILFLTTLSLGIVGGADDYLKLRGRSSRGLPGRTKLLAQTLVALLLVLYLLSPRVAESLHFGEFFAPPVARDPGAGAALTLSLKEYATRLYMPFFKDPLLSFQGGLLLLFPLFTSFVVVGTSNAVNLSDGLDGLAVGLLILVASTLSGVAFLSNNSDLAGYLNILYIDGAGEIAVYLAALVGACLGFLWYNGHPAELFMGDTGSIALGGIIGVSAILLGRELLLALIGGVFVAEALSVILQVGSFRLRGGRRIFLCTPLHHHFEYKGWPEMKVVVRFWIVGLLLAIVGIATLKFQ